ncbi:MAG: hypothetical protein HY679_02075 [Chloroflexi bacterium]|nr:hypothetical protein [Chloroflexota bacterium]
MRQNTEPVAWTVLFSSFAVFVALVVGVVFGLRWFLFDSEVSQNASVTLISGTVLLTRPGAALPEAVVQTITGLNESAQIDSEAGSQASVAFTSPRTDTPLGDMQVYGSTLANLDFMRSPRFDWSARPNRVAISVTRGRARVSTAVGVSRQVIISVQTPQGLVVLERPGSYSIDVTEAITAVAVHDGAVTVIAQGSAVILAANERTTVQSGEAPAGVLTGARNLIVNGDFATPLSPDWTTFKDRADPADVEGQIDLAQNVGRNAAHFIRPGDNWGRVGIRQKINRDVRGYNSLRLHVAARILSQNVSNCGSLGSECPLMIKLEYTDVAGASHEWVQGFYYLSDPSNSLPLRCVTCPPPGGAHQRIQQNVWYLYDSPELIALFAASGQTPATITAISIYAEGHSVESFISEVELLAGD